MANTPITNLPVAISLSGAETVPIVQNGTTSRTTTGAIALLGQGNGTVTNIVAGTGLNGGTITVTGTISLANTTVTAASYGTTSTIPTLVINDQGQITAASNNVITGVGTLTSGAIGSGFTAIPNTALANSAITINSTPVSLGGTITLTAGTVSSINVVGGTTGLTTSGGPITTSGSITLGGTLAVGSGGTGVTASSGANSVVLRDASANVTANALLSGYTNFAAAGTTTVLTAASVFNWVVTGSGGQTYQLPSALTLPVGASFAFNNNQTSGTIAVNNNSSTLVVSVPSGGYVTVTLLTNSLAAGTWDVHYQAPANVSWSTNTFNVPASITGATWNGNVVGPLYGGTGVANNGTNTITLAGPLTHAGAFSQTFTATGTTSLTLPTSGTITAQGNSVTGSGGTLVLATGPVLVTPTLGAASATTVNNVTITNPGTTAVLTLANGSTLSTAGNVTYAGAFGQTFTATGTTSLTLPTTGTLATTGNVATSFQTSLSGLTPSTATTGAVTLAGTLGVGAGGTGTATAFTTGSVVFSGASGVYSQSNANIFWDNTNFRLGIGSATPGSKLTVAGPISLKAPTTVSATTYTQVIADSSLIFTTAGTCTITLLAAATYPGQFLYMKAGTTATTTVTSASSNVVPLGSTTAGTAIMLSTGKFTVLQSDGTNWQVMMQV